MDGLAPFIMSVEMVIMTPEAALGKHSVLGLKDIFSVTLHDNSMHRLHRPPFPEEETGPQSQIPNERQW